MNKDNYQLFTAGGVDFLIIHLEVDAPDYVLNWADDIIGRHPERQVIISTHQYLDASGSYDSMATTRSDGNTGQQIWDKLIKTNCSIFLVVNGHSPGENRRTDDNTCGEPVHQIVTDYPEPGERRRRLAALLHVRAGNGRDRCFHVQRPLRSVRNGRKQSVHAAARDVGCERVTEIGSATTASGRIPSARWFGLGSNTEYEWYALVSDGTSAVRSETWSFTTGEVPAGVVWPDFDGDGSADRGVFRPEVGGWYVEGQMTAFIGSSADVPVPADYDGDGATDRAVFRDGAWFSWEKRPGSWGRLVTYRSPVTIDGDGTAEVAVFRDGVWFVEGQNPGVLRGGHRCAGAGRL